MVERNNSYQLRFYRLFLDFLHGFERTPSGNFDFEPLMFNKKIDLLKNGRNNHCRTTLPFLCECEEKEILQDDLLERLL